MTLDPAAFRHALGQFATGVTVVTTRDREGRPFGLTISSFCSLSMDPPLVLVCVGDQSDAHPAFEESRRFAVSILAEGQEEVSWRFAWGGPEKFAGLAVEVGSEDAILIPGAVAHLECAVVAAHPGGDHTIYVGEILTLTVHPGPPLLYHSGTYRRLKEDKA